MLQSALEPRDLGRGHYLLTKAVGGLTVSSELTSLGLDKKQLELEEMEEKKQRRNRRCRGRRQRMGENKTKMEEEEVGERKGCWGGGREGRGGEEAAMAAMPQEQVFPRKARNQAGLCLRIHLLIGKRAGPRIWCVCVGGSEGGDL